MADAPAPSSIELAIDWLLWWAYSDGSRAADRDLGLPPAERSLPRMRALSSSSIQRRLCVAWWRGYDSRSLWSLEEWLVRPG